MLNQIPNTEQMTTLIGESLYKIWNQLCTLIDEKYNMECLWSKGGKEWTYEYKYRRGGKTLCALYAKENCVGFMIIFGKEERLKFEEDRASYTKEIQRIYDEAKTYHDGKWMMFEPTDTSMFDDFIRLLHIRPCLINRLWRRDSAFFRHMSQKSSGIHKGFPAAFVPSAEKIRRPGIQNDLSNKA